MPRQSYISLFLYNPSTWGKVLAILKIAGGHKENKITQGERG